MESVSQFAKRIMLLTKLPSNAILYVNNILKISLMDNAFVPKGMKDLEMEHASQHVDLWKEEYLIDVIALMVIQRTLLEDVS